MKIIGVVIVIIFESADSLFKVIKVKTSEESIIVTGNFAGIREGLTYEFEGEYLTHAKFGHQFKATTFKQVQAQTDDALIKYLSSSTFEGIGIKTAEKIVNTLGLNALEIIQNDPNALLSVPSISEKKALSIRNQIINNQKEEKIFLKLYSYGLSANNAKKIYLRFLEDTIETIEKNPYVLTHEIDNFGFLKCDEIALQEGFDLKSKIRLREAIIYTLKTYTIKYGFTYMYQEELFDLTIQLLNKTSNCEFVSSDFNNVFISLITDNEIYKIDTKIFPRLLYLAETNVNTRIKQILNTSFNHKNRDLIVDQVCSNLDFKLTSEQISAIKSALSNKISIITGGPGTGKTTILKCLLKSYSYVLGYDIDSKEFKDRVLLISPTGKASKRLSVQCAMSASTIHKALEYDESGRFQKGIADKLKASLIVVDESSMIDIELMSHLLDAVNDAAQIVFVGDIDQLPSVGPGNVLADMISSGIINVSYLTQIMRQKNDSKIIELAHEINTNTLDLDIFNDKKELFFYETSTNNILSFILKIVERYIALGNDIYQDLQILAPMYSKANGIDNINKAIQEEFNKSTDLIKYGDKVFKVGDKVLNLSNKPDLKIMNGDTGIIKGITKVDSKYVLHILFDSYMVEYPYDELDSLTLGYAISIHKSQGSEFKNVIIPMSFEFSVMLKKKLIYTAITRAKEKLIFIGSKSALESSLNKEEDVRRTNLANFLNPKLYKETDVDEFIEETLESDIIKIDDPLSAFDFIGESLGDITPYSFMEDIHD